MEFYRGDDRPFAALNPDGFRAREPMTTQQAFAYLHSEIRARGGPSDLAQHLRSEPNRRVVATARVLTGGYQGKNLLYRITIPDSKVQIRLVDKGGGFGPPISEAELSKKDHFIVYDDPVLENASVVAFGHGWVDTKEVTFLTDIPWAYVSGFKNGGNTTRDDVPFAHLPKPA